MISLNNKAADTLSPLTAVRPVADLLIGILTIAEKWKALTGKEVIIENDSVVDASVIPDLNNADRLMKGQIAEGDIVLHFPWDLFKYNAEAIARDFAIVTRNRKCVAAPPGTILLNPGNIFIEEGAEISYAIINADDGPVYIGKGAKLMEGVLIRGPVSIGENSAVKMGARLYAGTTIGSNCVAAGEIKNSIISSNSNKAHDGYLGDSVIGQWCNLGAGTTNSNVKNTASRVIYEHHGKKIEAEFKGGLIMGDYSRSAINTSFNTATITGICCNIFSSGLVPKSIPHFTWGEKKYELEKALQHVENWKRLKHQTLSNEEIAAIKKVYNAE